MNYSIRKSAQDCEPLIFMLLCDVTCPQGLKGYTDYPFLAEEEQ